MIISDLVFIYENFHNLITEKDMRTFYAYIAFNYTFLHDVRFLKAVEFAKARDLVDTYGRTVVQANEIYKKENKNMKVMSF